MLSRFPAQAETKRLKALRSYEVLDTRAESSFDQIVQLTAELTGSPTCLVSLIDHERQWIKARYGFGPDETPREQAFCSHAISIAGGALVVPDATLDPRFSNNPLVIGPPHIRFYAGIALVNQEGAALGALCILDDKPRDLSDNHLNIMKRLAETVMTALELRRSMNQMRRLATLDLATGLVNRAALFCGVENAIAQQRLRGGRFGLVGIDLTGLRRVNDERGHEVGDEVLRTVGEILTETTGDHSLSARIGSHEFAVLLTDAASHTLSLCERIRDRIAQAICTGGWPVRAAAVSAVFEAPPLHTDAAMAIVSAQLQAAKRRVGDPAQCLA